MLFWRWIDPQENVPILAIHSRHDGRKQARRHARDRRARAIAREEESKRELQAVQAELIKAEVPLKGISLATFIRSVQSYLKTWKNG